MLIHGAGLGSWIWRDVIPLLPGPALAVDLPGRAAPAAARRSLTLADYEAAVADQIETFAAHRVVLVAHSVAGVLASGLIERLGDRVVGFAAVAAAIPRPGGSFLSTLPLPQRIVLRAILRIAGTRPPDAMIRKGLCSDLDADTTAEVVGRFAPESRALYVTRVRSRIGRVPSLYLRLSEDRELDPAQQRRMAAGLGATEVEIAAGHLPMLSKPAALAAALDAFTDRLR